MVFFCLCGFLLLFSVSKDAIKAIAAIFYTAHGAYVKDAGRICERVRKILHFYCTLNDKRTVTVVLWSDTTQKFISQLQYCIHRSFDLQIWKKGKCFCLQQRHGRLMVENIKLGCDRFSQVLNHLWTAQYPSPPNYTSLIHMMRILSHFKFINQLLRRWNKADGLNHYVSDFQSWTKVMIEQPKSTSFKLSAMTNKSYICHCWAW